MSAVDPKAVVRRVRAALASIVVAQALLLGATVGVLIAAVRAAEVVGGVAAAVVAVIVVWRSRAVWSLEHAALWVEERDRALQYALVTAVDPRYATREAPTYQGPLLRRAAVRAIGPVVLACALAVGLSEIARAHHLGLHRTGQLSPRASGSAKAPSRLTPLLADIAPPAYSHLPARHVKEPTSVASLVGSAITFRGPGDTAGLRVVLDDKAASVAANGEGWSVAITMPAAARVVKIVDGEKSRLVVLTPVPDAPPVVELTAPARDSTMRAAQGTLPLVAKASDDIGLADGYFEVIVSAGEEETGGVHGHTLTVGRVAFHDARAATMASGLAFDALHLNPGDVVSIRAVARDGNTVSGPGVGASETRTFRLATKEEYDSIAVEGAPPPGMDSSYMSQRLIVIATQDLLARMRHRPSVVRDTVVRISRHLGNRQENLKNKVYQLLYGGDGGPGAPRGEAMPAEERVLFDTAYHAMTDASMSLAIAEPKEALPRELVALVALDSVRKMQHRMYLRGQPPQIVVNIARVRMTGTEQPDAGARTAATPTDTLARRLQAELVAIGSRPIVGRPGLGDSLALMQVAAFGVSPAIAAALGDAGAALRARQDPTPALARARRLLMGTVRVDTSRVAWMGGGGTP